MFAIMVESLLDGSPGLGPSSDTVFHPSWIPLDSLLRACRTSPFSAASPASVVFRLDDSQSDRAEVLSHCGFDLQFPGCY